MFGIDLWDASIAPALLVAGLAGLLSFLSPCVLPIVPPYLAFMAGASIDDLQAGRDADRRILRTAAFFVLGLSTVFLLLGMAASSLGRALLTFQYAMTLLAGVVIALFGLHFLRVVRIPLLYRDSRIDAPISGRTPFGAYVLGLAFAFGWTPCIGPILAAILAVAGTETSVGRGALLLAVYSAGLGIPFLVAAFAMKPFTAFMKRIRSRFALIEKTMGALLVLTGVAFLAGWLTDASFWLLETFPALGRLG